MTDSPLATARPIRFFSRAITQKTLSRLCVLVLVCMLAPMLWIAVYTYGAEDDFTYLYPAASAWCGTGSLLEVGRAIVGMVRNTYATWQGDFISTAFFSLSPMVFDINLYFLSCWFLISFFCLSVAYVVRALLRLLRCEAGSVFWIALLCVLIPATQFLPCVCEGFYWHNGGMYMAAESTLLLLIGLTLRCLLPQSRARAVWRGVSMAVCGFLLGGSFYGPALSTAVFLLLSAVYAFWKKRPNRFQLLAALGCLIAALALSMAAPGNVRRQLVSGTGEAQAPLTAILTAVLDSFDLIGGWLLPHVLAMLLVLAPLLWKPLKSSPLTFSHPFLLTLLLYGLFSSALVPGIYTGVSYQPGRYMNIVYVNFLLLFFGASLYWLGWLIRRLERRSDGACARLLEAANGLGERFHVGYLLLCVTLLVLGGFSFTIMNTTSVSAVQSLVTGQAQRYHAGMLARQEDLLAVSEEEAEAQVHMLVDQPYVFMPDKVHLRGGIDIQRYAKLFVENQSK